MKTDSMHIQNAIIEGNTFAGKVMDLETSKKMISIGDLEAHLNKLLAEFAQSLPNIMNVRLRFGDVHAKMGRKWHTELAYVDLDGFKITLLFDLRLIDFTNRSAGLIFVAKSWVLILVIAQALFLNSALRSSFVFEIGDYASLGEVGFSSCHPSACTILDYDFAASEGYALYRRHCDLHMVPWEQRSPKIFWRGSTTGRRLFPAPPENEEDNLLWLTRLALCMTCRAPELRDACDVGITQVVQIDEPHLHSRIVASELIKPPVPREHFMHYKGVFDVDGNANAWSGLFCSLLGASCVLKIESQDHFREWYYDRLIPWKNYIPIRSDLSDIRDIVSWFTNNPDRVQEIAEAGRQLSLLITVSSAIEDSANNLLRWIYRRP